MMLVVGLLSQEATITTVLKTFVRKAFLMRVFKMVVTIASGLSLANSLLFFKEFETSNDFLLIF